MQRNSSFQLIMFRQNAAFTMIVAITIPFFGGLLGFFGGFAFAPTTYFVSYYTTFSSSNFKFLAFKLLSLG